MTYSTDEIYLEETEKTDGARIGSVNNNIAHVQSHTPPLLLPRPAESLNPSYQRTDLGIHLQSCRKSNMQIPTGTRPFGLKSDQYIHIHTIVSEHNQWNKWGDTNNHLTL